MQEMEQQPRFPLKTVIIVSIVYTISLFTILYILCK